MAPLKQSDRKKKRSDEKKKKQKLIIGESDKGKKKQRSKEKKKKKLITGESDKGKKKQSDKKEKSWKMKMCGEEKKKRSDVEMIEERKKNEEENEVAHPRWDWDLDFFDPSVRGGAPPAAQQRSWPELVGLTGEEAKAKIEEEMPGDWVGLVPQRRFVSDDFRLDRVRIFIDSDGKVVLAPTVG